MSNIPSALLFPGQGSQEAAMGQDVAETSKEAMDLWKKAENISQQPLRAIYWESNDPALMADTRTLQPALTVVNINLWREFAPKLERAGYAPMAVAGHSLGEYSALAAASVLSVDTVLELVSLRGALMAEADPSGVGAMAAVLKLSLDTVRALVDDAAKQSGECLLIANYNTPSQYVISGHKTAVELATSMVKEHKGRAMPLPVSGAFHSPLMQEAAVTLGKSLQKATWNKPRWPVYANVSARPVTDGESLCELVTQQMTASVRFVETIERQWQHGARAWLEIGPKGVLSRMIKPIIEDVAQGQDIEVHAIKSLEAVEMFGEG